MWECWVVDVTLATSRSENGKLDHQPIFELPRGSEADISADGTKTRRQMERSLQKASMKIISVVNRDRNHIPPITTTEANPFPYQILVNPKNDGWGQKMGIF